MKPKLLLLSDLWGVRENTWIEHYVKILNPKYRVAVYNCCKIGGVDVSDDTESILHQQFIDFGIRNAVETLLKKEQEMVDVLAFSVGGTIAWKSVLRGLSVNKLWAVSSTRLRYEESKPDCKIQLFFGGNDKYIPSVDWFKTMKVDHLILDDVGHELYTETLGIRSICNELLKT